METTSLTGLNLGADNREDLRETARWAKFLAIVGFILCGLMILASFFVGQMVANMSTMSRGFQGMDMPERPGSGALGTLVTVVYLLIALLYFFPCLYLYRFSSNMMQALDNEDQPSLNHSFRNLKSLFKFLGILTIIFLCFYVIGMIGFIIGVSTMHMSH